MQRLGRADDVAALAVFLASDESSFISGNTIFVDGAMMARLPAPFLTPGDVTGGLTDPEANTGPHGADPRSEGNE